jgi:methyl-accepting chemotaxis protein
MNMEKKSTRKKYLTNPNFQLSFVGIIVGFSGINLLMIYLAQRYFFLHYVQSGKKTGLPLNHVFFQLLRNQQHYMNRIFILTAFFILVFGFIFGLLYSHRIIGPINRLKDFLDRDSTSANQGSVSEREILEIRNSDYFKDLASSINEFIRRKNNK